MEVVKTILDSIKGNVKTKSSDPLIGAFVCSWVLCNWDKLVILFWGKSSLEDRINNMVHEMSFLTNPALIWFNYDLLLLPLALAAFYVFLMPKISVKVAELLADTEIARHAAAVSVEVAQAKKQSDLSEERLLGDPNEEYLKQRVEGKIALEQAQLEEKQAEAAKAVSREKSEAANAKKREANKATAELELEAKKRQDELGKMEFSESAAVHKSVMQANAYTSSYQFINLLDQSVNSDGVSLSLNALSQTISSVFGYANYSSLLSDKHFNNDDLRSLKYVLCDADYLTERFEGILFDEHVDEEQFGSEWLMGHVEVVFESLPYDLIYPDALAENVQVQLSEDSGAIFNSEEFSAAQAGMNTIFEDLDLSVEGFDHSDVSFSVTVSGSASGHHRKESDVPGQPINVQVIADLPVMFGKFGLPGEYDLNVEASPEYYDDEEKGLTADERGDPVF